MTDAKKAKPEQHHKRGLRERLAGAEHALHDHLIAAEVAAEEAAGYGSVTAAVEAAEAAIDPAHELGDEDDARPRRSRKKSEKGRAKS